MSPEHRTIVWRVHLASPPERVYWFLSSDLGRAQFWAESAVERAGHIEFHFSNGVRTRSRIIEQLPSQRYVIEYFETIVEFALMPDGKGGTDVTMMNTKVPPDEYLEMLPGWLNVLLPLKAAADHGVDLRNHDPTRTWDQRFVDH